MLLGINNDMDTEILFPDICHHAALNAIIFSDGQTSRQRPFSFVLIFKDDSGPLFHSLDTSVLLVSTCHIAHR